ncbi:hypothetical protein DB30_06855 [Enhygromyxa salina]|uniref:L,D-TPase catalytic domain-containing protein n=1 Tax=Enhygromyxa salina TaxID=215803 RepID=A0A0C2CXK9_9BACT|nr:L,D-transpeptidase [Enhygromyxa salina]KIG14380.1 hypothetical protein DB30_06855 [Enhygromyxa salina]
MIGLGPRRAISLASILGFALVACRGETTSRPRVADERAAPPAAVEPGPSADADGASQPPALEPYKPPSSLGEPIEIRRTKRTRMVYADLDERAAIRGRIPSKQSFEVFEKREGPGCSRAWALVAAAAWICLEHTEPSDVLPAPLPTLDDGALLPFLYGRHEHHDVDSTPPIPAYASVSDARAHAKPVEMLPAYGSYAFTRYRPNNGDPLLTTIDRRVVRAAELTLFDPSEFGGRELDQAPIPAGQTLAWAIRWQTLIRVERSAASDSVARIKYHDTLLVAGEGVLGEDGERWFEVPATQDHGRGWISDHDIGRFVPVPPPTPVRGGQITVDIDLDEQVLSVWLEAAPVFVTLISSGKRNDETPPGIYRIENKRAYGKMQSTARARDPYYVDAVPWTMYFQGRYALHAAYWHDMFGHRMSHGCVNLSPRDARRVFELTSPTLPNGWLLIHEHPDDPGAVVRVRKANAPTPDVRGPLGVWSEDQAP